MIGCGFDFTRRSIFYTLNGDLLGTGFTDVEEDILHPIIGFHGNSVNQKVSINFGVEPFKYEGPEVMVNANSLTERDARRQRLASNECESEIPVESTAGSVDGDSSPPVIAEDSSALETYRSRFLDLRFRVESLSRAMQEVRRMRKYCRGLLRFLLALVCENDSTLPIVSDIKDKTKLKPPALTKGRSAFGTPKFETYGDGALLVQDMCNFFLTELTQSASFLKAATHSEGYLFCSNQDPTAPNDNDSQNPLSVDSIDITTHQDSFRALDFFDVEGASYEVLLGLRALVLLSKQAKSSVCRSECVCFLISLLEFGSTRIRDLAAPILTHALNDMLPEDVEAILSSSSLTSKLVETVLSREISGSDRRVRKLPDSIIKILFRGIKNLVQTSHVNSHGRLYGKGSALMHCALTNAAIIYQLLDSISYSELVSCFLTEAIRHVDVLMGKVSPDHGTADSFASATAAGIVMSGVTSKHCRGAKVSTKSGSGTVLDYDENAKTFSVILSSSFKSFHNVVQIKEGELFRTLRATATDLSALSQPLLPQMISAFKVLLAKIKSSRNLDACNNANKMFWRLTSCISQAISCMINGKQDGVTDAIMYADVIPEVVAVSLLDSGLEHFAAFDEVQEMWRTCVARSLEICHQNGAAIASAEPDVTTPQTSQADSELAAQAEMPEDVVEKCGQEHDVDLAQSLSSETGVDVEECSQLLAYFMQDVDSTRAYIITNPGSLKCNEDSVKCGGSDALLSSISLQAPDRTISRSKYVAMEFGGYADAPESLRPENMLGNLVLEPGAEGASCEEGRVGQAEPVVAPSSELPIAFYHYQTGVHLNELVRRSQLRVVRGIYGSRSAEELSDFLMRLDRSLSVIHLREVVMTLLYDCSINILSDAARLEDWIRLIKLSSVSGKSETARSNCDMCAALVKAARTNLYASTSAPVGALDERIIVLLINELLDNLRRLMRPDKHKVKSQLFRSAHPFLHDRITWGEIEIPEGSLGAIFSFDSRCCTPSKLARLMLYASKADFDNETPLHEFWGAPGSSYYFKSFYAPKVRRLYYKFIAEKGSNKSEVQLVYDSAKVKVNSETKVCKGVPVVSRASTGEDDSLSNFFDAPLRQDDDPSLVQCDCDFMSSGQWFFEVSIESIARDDDQAESCGNVRVGLIDNTCDTSSQPTSLNGVYMMSVDGSCTFDLQRISSVSFQNQDVVGVRYSINDGALDVSFLLNGTEISRHSCKIAGVGVKPAVFVVGGASLACNFGDKPFKFPSAAACMPVHCRQKDIDPISAFGYEFTVEPVTTVPYQISREFDLVFSHKGHDIASSVYIWRPICKFGAGYANIGDIATSSKIIPLGGLTVRKDMCRSPIEYKLAFLCTKTSMAIWRPVPPDGYVSLGDVFYYSADQTPPLDLTVCVPSWATKPCALGTRVYFNKSTRENKTHSMSVWWLNGGAGLFRGTRTVDSSGIEISSLCSMVADVESEITGEWFTERDVLHKPSLSWSCDLLKFLMDESTRSDTILKESSLFPSLVDYISSWSSPNPLKLVPYVIRFIRLAAKQSSAVDVARLRPLCKSIAHSMAGKSSDVKKSPGHQMLADLVVECERYRLALGWSGAHEPFQYSDDISDELKLEARLLDSASLSKLLNRDSMLTKVRSVLSFFNSIEDSSGCSYLSSDLLCKVWFDSLSLTSIEQSQHPHNFEKYLKSVCIPGAERYSIILDRRSDLAEGCSLKISGGGSVFLFKGGEEADTFTKPIVFIGPAIEIVFEASGETPPSPDCPEHWGWSILIDCMASNAYETAKVRVKLGDNDGTNALTPLLAGENSSESADTINPVEAVPVQDVSTSEGEPSDTRRVDSPDFKLEITDIVLEKAVELGRLIDSNEIHLPFDTDKIIEVRRNAVSHGESKDAVFYVLTFIYECKGEQKTLRTALKENMSIEFKANECRSVTYMIHAIMESRLKVMFSNSNASEVPPDNRRPSSTAPSAEVQETPATWSCGTAY